MDLSIIILNYNTKNLLKECLRAIRLASPKLRYEVIVVDNDSKDRSGEMVLSSFPEVRFIRSGKNVGYAGGNNVGIRSAAGRYLMIMNADILICPDSLETLVRYMEEHPKVGMVGPQLLNPNGSVQHSCYRFPTPMTPIYRRTFLGRLPFGREVLHHYLMEDFDHGSVREVDWLLGGALLARQEAVAEVGFLDEAFFLYFEDTDWCRRFWEKGWKVVYVPEAKMIHFHKRASQGGFLKLFKNRTARIHLRSAFTYFRKYRGKANPRISRV